MEETGAYYIQSELSQKEKHQYSTLTHIYEIQKDGNNNPVREIANDGGLKSTFEGRGWDDLGEWH